MGLFGGSKLIGLDIGASSVKAISGSRKKNSFSVDRLVIIPIPARSIDERGIVNPEAVGMAVATALKEIASKNPSVATLIHGSSVITKRIIMEVKKKNEISEAVKWEAEQVFPQDVSSTLIEHVVLGENVPVPNVPGAKGFDVLLVGIREEEANMMYDMVTSAPGKLKYMDLEALAISDFLEGIAVPGPDGSVGLIDVGASATRVAIKQHDKVVFLREFPIAGNSFTDAIATALGQSFENAEALKVQEDTGIPQEAVEAMQGLLQTWKSEVQACEDVYVTQYNRGPVGRWYIFGGGARTPGLFDVMRDQRFADRVAPLPAPEIFKSGSKNVNKDYLSVWSYRLVSAAAAACRKA